MELKSKLVDVEGIGQVEIRELDYSEAEPLFDMPSGSLGKALIKACLYKDGVRIFDGKVGLSVATELFKLSGEVLEINGMGKSAES